MPPADMLSAFTDAVARMLGAAAIALLGCGLAGQWSGRSWLAGRPARVAGVCLGLALIGAPALLRALWQAAR